MVVDKALIGLPDTRNGLVEQWDFAPVDARRQVSLGVFLVRSVVIESILSHVKTFPQVASAVLREQFQPFLLVMEVLAECALALPARLSVESAGRALGVHILTVHRRVVVNRLAEACTSSPQLVHVPFLRAHRCLLIHRGRKLQVSRPVRFRISFWTRDRPVEMCDRLIVFVT